MAIGQLGAGDGVRRVPGDVLHGPWALPPHDAPLMGLLSEIRGLRSLRHRGQISAVEYERRRRQVLEKI